VRDRASREPFAPETRLDARIRVRALERGLMCYPMHGTIDGRRRHHVLLAPPFIVTEEQLDEIVDRLAPAIEQAIAGSGDV